MTLSLSYFVLQLCVHVSNSPLEITSYLKTKKKQHVFLVFVGPSFRVLIPCLENIVQWELNWVLVKLGRCGEYRNNGKHCTYINKKEGRGMYWSGMPLSASNRKAEQPWLKQQRIYFSRITKSRQLLAIGLATQLHTRAQTLALFLLSALHKLAFAPRLSPHGYEMAFAYPENACPLQSRKKRGMAKGHANCTCPLCREIKIPQLISIFCLHLIGQNWVTWLPMTEAEK